MEMQNLQKQKGFTLVEIAIVLVIIGLLLGGVLKGQELITNTKIKAIKADADALSTAINGYQDRFRAMPGDDAAAVANVAGTLATTGGTAGNGLIEGLYIPAAAATDETSLIFQHLRLAGFISGDATSNVQPASAFGGIVGVTNATTNLAGLIICQSGLSQEEMQLVDIRYDDGDSTAGTIRGVTAAAGTETAIAYTDTPTNFDSIALCMQY